MDKKKVLRISWYVLVGALTLFTIMFFLDIKFVVMGINILVLDALTAGIWIFVRLCKWASRENTGRRTAAVIAITLAGLFAAPVLLFGLAMYGGIPQYAEGIEPQTHRTFVVEYRQNMLLKGTAKTPEQILEEQPIDDTHDAFLVSTGGKLGTLLVTAELAEQSKSEFGARDITFSVWNPAEMEQPIQTFSEEVMLGVAPEFHHVVDANFDGFQDFGYLFHAGNQPNYWHYWLWDEEQEQFEYYAPLIEISQPVFNAERQIVRGWARSSAATGTDTIYRWMNGELTLVRRIYTDFTQLIVVEDLIDGQMVEVYREEWQGEPDDYNALYEWYDPDYHGEPTEGNYSNPRN